MSTLMNSDIASDNFSNADGPITGGPAAKSWLWDWVLIFLPILGLLPLLLLHGIQLWSRPTFQFYPVVVVVLILGFVLSEKGISRIAMRRNLALVVGLIGFALAFYAAFVFAPTIACGSIGLFTIAWGLVRLSKNSIGRSIAVGLLVFSLIPLPLNLDARFESWLNNIVAPLTINILDVFQVFCLQQAPYIAIESTTINYIDYLSNAFSFRAILSFILFLIIIKRRAFLSTLLSICSGVGCVIVAKLLLLTGAVLLANSGTPWNEGTVWWILPWCTAITGLILCLIFESLWGSVFEPIKTGGEVVFIDRTKSANIFNRIVYWPGTIVEDFAEHRMDKLPTTVPDQTFAKDNHSYAGPSIVLIGLAIVVALLAAPLGMAIQKQKLLFNSDRQFVLAPDKLPDNSTIPPNVFSGLRLNQYQNNSDIALNVGRQIHLWSYSGIDSDAKVVLLFPVNGWTTVWSLGTEETWSVSGKSETSLKEPWPFSEKNLVASGQRGERFAKFFSTQFTQEGRPYLPNPQELVDAPVDAPVNRWIEPRLLHYLKDSPEEDSNKTFVIQMQFESSEPLRTEDEEALRKVYFSIRDTLVKKVAGLE